MTSSLPWAQQMLRSMRASGHFTDGALVVAGTEIPVHRTVLVAASPFFASAFTGGFSEAKTGRVVIHDASHEAVDCLLDFIYGLDVFEGAEPSYEKTMEVLGLAQRLLIDRLTKSCVLHLVKMNLWDTELLLVCQALCPSTPPDILDELVLKVASQFFRLHAHLLDADMLLRVLRSPDLIGSDDKIVKCILNWISIQKQPPDPSIVEALFSKVSFSRLSPDYTRCLFGKNATEPWPVKALPSSVTLSALLSTSSEQAIHIDQVEKARPSRYGFALLSREFIVEHKYTLPVVQAPTRTYALELNGDYKNKETNELVPVCGHLALQVRFSSLAEEDDSALRLSVAIERQYKPSNLLDEDDGIASILGECYMGVCIEFHGNGRHKVVSELKRCQDLVLGGENRGREWEMDERFSMVNFGTREFWKEKAANLTIFVGERVCD